MIIVCQKPLKRLKINGIALFPFIFIRKPEDRENNILINHEKIHLRQQLELLVIFFYILYVIEYYYWLLKLKNKDLAYRRISFEREAYANESDLKYLGKRNFWSFRKYV
jgi:beta-lactamase regulating signal transducer with metallopeptidase domain